MWRQIFLYYCSWQYAESLRMEEAEGESHVAEGFYTVEVEIEPLRKEVEEMDWEERADFEEANGEIPKKPKAKKEKKLNRIQKRQSPRPTIAVGDAAEAEEVCITPDGWVEIQREVPEPTGQPVETENQKSYWDNY